jgi:hypothetical protein
MLSNEQAVAMRALLLSQCRASPLLRHVCKEHEPREPPRSVASNKSQSMHTQTAEEVCGQCEKSNEFAHLPASSRRQLTYADVC